MLPYYPRIRRDDRLDRMCLFSLSLVEKLSLSYRCEKAKMFSDETIKSTKMHIFCLCQQENVGDCG